MNFFGHLYLADDDPASRIGNLLPDLHHGPLPIDLDPAVRRGVARHRLVDAFTDTHPSFGSACDRLRPTHGRFAGVLVDVFFDHVLAVSWSRYHPTPLADFTADAYRSICSRPDIMPPTMLPIMKVMARQDWLGTYRTIDGIALTLRRMSRRLRQRTSRPIDLEPAAPLLAEHFEAFASDFDQLLADLRRRLQTLRKVEA